MKQFIIMMGCIWFIILTCTNAEAAIFSSDYELNANISSDTTLLNIGDTSIHGVLKGYKNEELLSSYSSILSDPIISELVNHEIIQYPHIFPLMSSTRSQILDEITVIPASIIESSSVNILDLISQVTIYKNVTLSIKNGIAVMITSGENIDISIDDSTLVSAISKFSFNGSSNLLSFISVSESKSFSDIHYNGQEMIIYPFSDEIEIVIDSTFGDELWNSNNQKSILLIQSNEIDFSDTSSIHAIPLDGLNNDNYLEIKINPSESLPEISSIIKNIEQINNLYDNVQIPYLSNQIGGESIFNSISPSLNGAILLYNTSDQVIIDKIEQNYNQLGFLRINEAEISLSAPESIKIQANSRLVFLGDHLYSQQASSSSSGVSVPIYPIFFWIILIVGYLIFIFYLNNKKMDQNYRIKKKYLQYLCIIIHIIGLILAYILLDSEIQHKLGNSFFQETALNGLTLFALVFFLIQIILWIIGYIFAALPLGILVKKILNFMGFDTSYQHLGKGAISLIIWPIATIYITMMINIVLIFFNPIEAFI